jgi:hypothetical protein
LTSTSVSVSTAMLRKVMAFQSRRSGSPLMPRYHFTIASALFS